MSESDLPSQCSEIRLLETLAQLEKKWPDRADDILAIHTSYLSSTVWEIIMEAANALSEIRNEKHKEIEDHKRKLEGKEQEDLEREARAHEEREEMDAQEREELEGELRDFKKAQQEQNELDQEKRKKQRKIRNRGR